MKKAWPLFLCLIISACLKAQEMEKKEMSITVYNHNFALVRDVRTIELKEGLNVIKCFDIAAQIEPASVSFKSLTAPDKCAVLEQNFEYDIVNTEKLLKKYIDRKIKIITKDNNPYSGYLSSYDRDHLVIAENIGNGPVYMITRENIRNIEFPQLPEGLITKPTLVWNISNEKAGKHLVELGYITQGINWQADYVAIVFEDEKNISLNGWVTVDNRSGVAFENAELKLMAGDVKRITEQLVQKRDGMEVRAMAAGAQFEEKDFFEYHLYTLGRKTSLQNNQTKQIGLFSATKVGVEKIYIYEGAIYRWYYYDNWQKLQYNKNVAVKMEMKNTQKNGLGIPLPKGKVRVYKADTDATLQFIGEDLIDHTPKDEKIVLSIGNAFDIKGERKITEHKKIAANIYRDSYEIKLRNHKKEPVSVKVIEKQFGDWTVLQSSHPYEKKDSETIEFNVQVAQNGETTLTYTSEYRF
ncbi:MAG: DUF4139 domain-containing protein [Candidatus Omnitrophica bacterium]|nr:DUF4139 domain-containing protein [Candidatus Omnitrophota bacterium]MCM8829030.1 DUF4139 domain-containing protein [Candidatus Omnitrophota bacterium]